MGENDSKEQSEGPNGKSSAEPCKDENNNSNQTFNTCDDSPKHSKTNGSHSNEKNVSKEKEFVCGLCSEQFQSLMEKNLHKKICFPQSDFLSSGMEDIIDSEFRNNCEKKSPAFICEFCDQKFTNMVWHTKHLNSCAVKKEKQESSYSKEDDENLSSENIEKERVEAEKRQKEKLEAKKKHREKLETQKREKEKLEAEKKQRCYQKNRIEKSWKIKKLKGMQKKQRNLKLKRREKKQKELKLKLRKKKLKDLKLKNREKKLK